MTRAITVRLDDEDHAAPSTQAWSWRSSYPTTARPRHGHSWRTGLPPASLHAPAVFPFEIANVLARLAFDGELEPGEVEDIWVDLAALDIALHPFDLSRDSRDVAAITARLRRRHATDSTYIALARRLDTALWTLDGSLARNAGQAGFPVRLVS